MAFPKWRYKARDHYGEYAAWSNAKNRCYKTEIHNFHNYGGRGIYMCDKWLNNFDAFMDDMGSRPEGYSLERIDVNGPYSPENCIWFPLKEQQKNTSLTVHITYQGVSRTSHEWAKLTGIREKLIRQRHNRGHSPEAILHNGPLKYGAQVRSCWGDKRRHAVKKPTKKKPGKKSETKKSPMPKGMGKKQDGKTKPPGGW